MTIADTKSCHKEWMESFDRAKVLQIRLVLIFMVSGAVAYYCNPKKGLPFLVGGGLTGMWAKREVGHGLGYGVADGLPCGLPGGQVFKLKHNIGKSRTSTLA